MPSIVHNDGWRSLSRSSTVRRRFSHFFRAPPALKPPRLPSATAFPPAHNRGLLDVSLGWRWLFLRHDLMQLRGLRIRKTLAPARDERPTSPRFLEFVRSQIEPIPCTKEKSEEGLERK